MTLHLPTKTALKEIAALCIEHRDDDEFIELLDKEKGMLVFSNFSLWRTFTPVARLCQNGEFFPEGRDSDTFNEVLEISGFDVARRWVHNRFRVRDVEPLQRGYSQRVLYRPVGSKLEERFALKVKTPKKRQRVQLAEN